MVDESEKQISPADRASGGPEISASENYTVLAGARVPDFDLGKIRAYAVRDERGAKENLVARICPPEAMPRLQNVGQVRNLTEASLLRPLDYSTVTWPGIDGSSTALIFARPMHGTLMSADDTTINPMHPDEITRCLFGPAVLTLGYMSQRSVTHRAIRPDNIYWDGLMKTSVQLGDCLSTGPAMMQPVLFESIESGMTPPVGRGPGTIADDFYALGVTTLILSLGRVPLQGLSPEEIVREKLRHGSFAALMEGERPPFGLRELLRGLLSDDTHNRWGLEQLEQWLGGGQRSSVQKVRTGSVPRSFRFDGKDYSNYRLLADAFGRDLKKAASAIGDPKFDEWLRKGLNDHSLADRMQAVLNAGSDSGRAARPGASQVTRVCLLLDPYGPIRAKGLVAMPSGIGSSLSDAFIRKDTAAIESLRNCLQDGAPADWFKLKGETETIIYEQKIKLFDRMQQFLGNKAMGYGIERCLYTLDPYHACRSAVTDGAAVTEARELLPAIEKVVQRRGEFSPIVDRHLIAFIVTRFKINIDRPLAALDLEQDDESGIKLAMLTIFARAQTKHGPAELPAMTSWFARELESTVNRINSRSFRDQMRKRIRALANGGSLIKLHACLSNDKAYRQDDSARKKAAREFVLAAKEIAQLESQEFRDSAQRSGWKIASGISTTVSVLSVCFVAFG